MNPSLPRQWVFCACAGWCVGERECVFGSVFVCVCVSDFLSNILHRRVHNFRNSPLQDAGMNFIEKNVLSSVCSKCMKNAVFCTWTLPLKIVCLKLRAAGFSKLVATRGN